MNNHRADLASSASMRCIDWRPFERNTLRGFATLQMRSGIVMSDIGIHQKGDKCWASPPGRPKLDPNGVAVRNRETGKIDYFSIVSFSSDQLRRRWSDEAIVAVRRDHPEAFEAPIAQASAPRPIPEDVVDDPVPF